MSSSNAASLPSLSLQSPGRPRGFNPEHALQAAIDVFWRQGYEATSLDDLTASMKLSRSSLYACFGSKHALLMAAVRMYADSMFEAWSAIGRSEPDPSASVRAILRAIADPEGDDRGCLLVNCITELAARDPELADLARAHIGRVAALVASILIRAGFALEDAERRAGALLSCAIGTILLRKAGIPAASIVGLLAETDSLVLSNGVLLP